MLTSLRPSFSHFWSFLQTCPCQAASLGFHSSCSASTPPNLELPPSPLLFLPISPSVPFSVVLSKFYVQIVSRVRGFLQGLENSDLFPALCPIGVFLGEGECWVLTCILSEDTLGSHSCYRS